MILRLLFFLIFTSYRIYGQDTDRYRYFELVNDVMISNYYWDNGVLIIDVYPYRRSLAGYSGLKKRMYVLPENQHLFKLPSKFRLYFDRLLKIGRVYQVTSRCPEDKKFLSDTVWKVYLEEYDVWIIRGDNKMYWHVCEVIDAKETFK
jgi:hypothetical protein